MVRLDYASPRPPRKTRTFASGILVLVYIASVLLVLLILQYLMFLHPPH